MSSRTSKVLALSMGQTLTTLAGIVSGMIASRLLSKHDYATMKQTMLAYSFVAPILMLGLPNALFFYLPKERQRGKGILIDNLMLIFIMAAIFSLFLFFGGYRILALRFNNSDLNTTLRWLIAYPLYMMPTSILGAVLLTQNKTLTLTLYNVISSSVLTGFTILGTILTHSFLGPLYAQIYVPILFLPVVLFLCLKYVPGKFVMPNYKSMLDMIKFSIPLGLAGMLGMIMLETNKFVISAMCNPEEFANYVNGAIEIPLIGIITGSVSSVILVDMTNYIHNGDKVGALDLFRKAAIKSSTILFPVMIFLLAAGKPFIVTLYSEKYLESVVPFYIYLFVLPVRIVMYGSALMALGQPKVILIRSIFDLIINIVLSIILVHLFGYLGAAIATILTLYLWTVPFNLFKIGKGFNVKGSQILPFRELGQILILCIAVVPLALTHHLVPSQPYYVKLFLASSLYFPIIGIILVKKGHLIIPDKILKFIPTNLAKLLIND